METSQTIYLTSTSKTIIPQIENDKKTTLAEICLCLFGVKEGRRENYKLISFVLLCSSASVVLNLYMDKRKNYISI